MIERSIETSIERAVSAPEPEGYVGPLDLVPGAVVAFDQFAPSASMIGQPYATIRVAGNAGQQFNFGEDGGAPVAEILAFLDGEPGIVEEWNDGAGGGKNSTAALEANMPTWDTTVLADSVPVLECDASFGRSMLIPSLTFDGGGISLIFIVKNNVGWDLNGAGSSYLQGFPLPDGNGFLDALDETGECEVGGTFSPAPPVGYAIWELCGDPATLKAKLNGVALSIDSNYTFGDALAAITGPSTLDIAPAGGLNSGIAAAYFYDTLLSDANLLALREVFAKRYGITI